MSFDRLIEKIDALASPVVVGLDPSVELIPLHITAEHLSAKGETLEALADAFFSFNRAIIDAVCDIVPAVKPQSAFYEALGTPGIIALQQTLAYAREKGMYIILDAKRGDIRSTAEAYAKAYLGAVHIGLRAIFPFPCDALTVNGYLGSDGLVPFLNRAALYDKAFFVLVKTSNPSSGQLQDLMTGEKHVYDAMGALVEELGHDYIGKYGYSPAGAVVGATYPEELVALRNSLPHTFFLVPGYGAQGGTAKDIAGAFDKNRRGAIVNSSRAILGAWKKTNDGHSFAEAARAEALRMRSDLRAALGL